jgi:polyisoprenoid-binding protein YceI
MNTLSTDQSRRDTYIREDGPRFNDFPVATFKATNVTAQSTDAGDGSLRLALTGDMTIRNITRPVMFDVRATINGGTLSGTATTRLKMSDFGIEPLDFYNTLTVADEVGVEVQFTARPPDPGAQP